MSESESMLRMLANNYFNPDYELDASDPDGIVRNFAREAGSELVGELIDELGQELAEAPSELDLRTLWLDTYDSYFEPETIGLTYREWFLRMLEILRTTPGG